jgi:flagellar motor switch protein FliG
MAISGSRKVAILLMSLDQGTASQVLQKLDKRAIEQVSREIAALSAVSDEERRTVIEEFYKLGVAQNYMEQGGMDFAKQLLERTFGGTEAEDMLVAVKQSMRATPFAFLYGIETQNLLAFIRDEHPQTIALILAHMTRSHASKVLGGLPADKQVEVVRRMAGLDQTSPEIIREVESALEHRLEAVVGERREQVGGVEMVAEMLNIADRATEKHVLESMEETNPELVEQIRRLMFVFEDLIMLDDKGIQKVLREIDNESLCLALKTASAELREKIFSNMTERAAAMVKEDMEYLGPVRLSQVEEAQQKIMDAVRALEDAGEIVIAGRGGQEEVLV